MQTNARNVGAVAASSCASINSQGQSAPPQPERPQKKGKDKKIMSCHACRRRKLKCDRSDPCAACMSRGEGHSCTWEEGQRPQKNNRGNLEQLPSLIEKLTEEVKQLKTSNSELIEKIRHKEEVLSLEDLSATWGTTPDISLSLAGSDSSSPSPDRKRWSPSRIAALLPESSLLRGLISHFLHAWVPLIGFVDVSQLVSEVEEVERVRRGMEISGSPVPPDHLDVKVSSILACASLAAVNLDAAKAQKLGIASINIDAFARDLWRKAMVLTTHLDLDSDCSTTCLEAVMSALPKTQPSLANSHANSTTTRASDSILLLRVVAIKLLLLLAARSFAAPSEYLKLHLDTISSAVDASLDSPGDDDMPLEEREWRWQLWSYLCVLDWTSPGIYHNGSYFIRPEMHSEPPSMVPRLPDDGKPTPPAEKDHWEGLSQTGYFLKYALALACLSRKAEDCIIRPGPISPVQAAELCSELDALEHKLSFYQLLGAGAGRGAESSGPNHSVSGSVSGGGPGGGTRNGNGGSPGLDEHRVSLQDALQAQHVHLGLELGLIRFKVFRHEAFHLMHDATTSGQLRMMCMDACVDACTFVLTQCRYIGGTNPGAEGMQSMMTMDLANGANCGEKRPYPGFFRRVIQPASSAALVGQVLLHASQSADGLGLLIPPDTHTNNTPVPMSHAGTNSSINANNSATDFLSPCAIERSMGNFGLQHRSANGNGNGGGASWTGRFRPEKVSILEWHVNTVMAELEALQSTSPLARNKLTLHRQCM